MTKKTTTLKDFRRELLRKGHITKESLMLAEVKLMLAELLHGFRTDKKMSQKELARAVGVSQPYIAKVEDGEENLTLETIAKLLSAFNIRLCLTPEKRGSHDSVFRVLKAA